MEDKYTPKMQAIWVKTELTDAELQEYGDQLAGLNKTLEGIELQKKAAMAAFKASIDDLKVEILNLATRIKDKAEEREYNCEVHVDPSTGVVTYKDPETGDVMKSRPATRDEIIDEKRRRVEENQGNIFGMESNA